MFENILRDVQVNGFVAEGEGLQVFAPRAAHEGAGCLAKFVARGGVPGALPCETKACSALCRPKPRAV